MDGVPALKEGKGVGWWQLWCCCAGVVRCELDVASWTGTCGEGSGMWLG